VTFVNLLTYGLSVNCLNLAKQAINMQNRDHFPFKTSRIYWLIESPAYHLGFFQHTKNGLKPSKLYKMEKRCIKLLMVLLERFRVLTIPLDLLRISFSPHDKGFSLNPRTALKFDCLLPIAHR